MGQWARQGWCRLPTAITSGHTCTHTYTHKRMHTHLHTINRLRLVLRSFRGGVGGGGWTRLALAPAVPHGLALTKSTGKKSEQCTASVFAHATDQRQPAPVHMCVYLFESIPMYVVHSDSCPFTPIPMLGPLSCVQVCVQQAKVAHHKPGAPQARARSDLPSHRPAKPCPALVPPSRATSTQVRNTSAQHKLPTVATQTEPQPPHSVPFP